MKMQLGGQRGRIVMAAVVCACVSAGCHKSPTGPNTTDNGPKPDSVYKPPIQNPRGWSPIGSAVRIAPSIVYASASPNGPTVVSCAGDTTRATNLSTSQSSQWYTPSGCGSAPAINAANGTVMTSGMDPWKIQAIATTGSTCIAAMPGNEARTVWAADGSSLIVGGQNGSVNLFDANCRLVRTLQTGKGTAVSSIAIQGPIAYATGSGPIVLTDANGQNQVNLATTSFSGTTTVKQMTFSPQGKSLAVIREGSPVIGMFSTDPSFSGYQFGGLEVNMETGFPVQVVTYCAERRTLVAAINDGSGKSRLQVWDPMVPTQVSPGARQTFEAHLMNEWPAPGLVRALVCDANGQRLSVITSDGYRQDYQPLLSNARKPVSPVASY